jgi:hypothetical protein
MKRSHAILVLALPTMAYASDMTAILFIFSFPACLVLIGIAFIMGATLTLRTIGWLALPIGGIALIHIYLLPHMAHGDELAIWAIQLAISATSLLAIRMVRKRAEREAAQLNEKDDNHDTNQS